MLAVYTSSDVFFEKKKREKKNGGDHQRPNIVGRCAAAETAAEAEMIFNPFSEKLLLLLDFPTENKNGR
jgi:hypothetical protein